jgi:hypothetical protein
VHARSLFVSDHRRQHARRVGHKHLPFGVFASITLRQPKPHMWFASQIPGTRRSDFLQIGDADQWTPQPTMPDEPAHASRRFGRRSSLRSCLGRAGTRMPQLIYSSRRKPCGSDHRRCGGTREPLTTLSCDAQQAFSSARPNAGRTPQHADYRSASRTRFRQQSAGARPAAIMQGEMREKTRSLSRPG